MLKVLIELIQFKWIENGKNHSLLMYARITPGQYHECFGNPIVLFLYFVYVICYFRGVSITLFIFSFIENNQVSAAKNVDPDRTTRVVASDLSRQCLSKSQFIRGGAKVLGKFPVPGRPTNLDNSLARALLRLQ